LSARRHRVLGLSADGFTLIEVIGALVIFSMGVLGVVLITSTLSVQMETAALRSELAIVGQERLDSLELLDYVNLTVGTTTSSASIRGETYTWSVTVSDSTAVIRHVAVTGIPYSGSGPFFSGSAFVDRSW
jgi:prepilin-type N-terminal cleavage/methylation domain-containing protein